MVQVVCFTHCKTVRAFILRYGNSNEEVLLHLCLPLDGESGLYNNSSILQMGVERQSWVSFARTFSPVSRLGSVCNAPPY